jgi:membrane protein DedA with SNARE-associated domain
MDNWIMGIIEEYGYIGILLLIALENIFPPIPSEVILAFGGYMTTTTHLTVSGVATSSTIGSVMGAVILYGIGLFINVNRMEKIMDNWGHILRLTRKDLYKANDWFSKYGVWTVFFCRFIPLIRSLISIPAGMSRMNFVLFFLLTTAGTFIWNLTLVKIGAIAGKSWESIIGFMDIYANVIYGLLIFLILFGILLIKKRGG